jgi:predicted ester cyclase
MKNSTIILSILFCFLISFQDVQAQTALEDLNTKERTEAQNIAVIKRVYQELNTNKNVQIFDELYDPEYKLYSPSNSRNPRSLEQSKNIYSSLFEAFTDLKFEIKNIFADGDYVIVRNVFSGTHENDYFGTTAMGYRVESGEIIIYQLQYGKIVEERYEFNSMDFTNQMKNEIPDGWWKGGDSRDSYSVGIDEEIKSEGSRSAFIVSLDDEIDGFTTLAQISDAAPFRGKKIKMTGYAKSENIEGWAGFWLRIDGEKKVEEEMSEKLGFDNMEDRPIKGTTDWTKYVIEMEVPDESVKLFYGLILNGKGKVWFDNVSFQEVTDKGTRDTKVYITEGPINTSFEDQLYQ